MLDPTCSANTATSFAQPTKTCPKASWELSGDNTTLAGASLPGYPSLFARIAQRSQGQLDIFYSSCVSQLSVRNTLLVWLTPPIICISCAHSTDEFYELTFEHIHPKNSDIALGLCCLPALTFVCARHLSPLPCMCRCGACVHLLPFMAALHTVPTAPS